jgi:hypothetical protein
MLSQRPRTPDETGRKLRSNSPWRRATVPTIDSSVIVCSPRSDSLRRPSAATTSSKGSMSETSSGSKRRRDGDLAQRAGAPLPGEVRLGILLRQSGASHWPPAGDVARG